MLHNVDWYLVIDVSAQSIGTCNFQESKSGRLFDAPIGCSETLVSNYHSMLRNITEERGPSCTPCSGFKHACVFANLFQVLISSHGEKSEVCAFSNMFLLAAR
jgi:hypothetical protein